MSKITIHKVRSVGSKEQPICGTFVSPFNPSRQWFVSVHDETVNCPRCLKLFEEMKHKQADGRLVF